MVWPTVVVMNESGWGLGRSQKNGTITHGLLVCGFKVMARLVCVSDIDVVGDMVVCESLFVIGGIVMTLIIVISTFLVLWQFTRQGGKQWWITFGALLEFMWFVGWT